MRTANLYVTTNCGLKNNPDIGWLTVPMNFFTSFILRMFIILTIVFIKISFKLCLMCFLL